MERFAFCVEFGGNLWRMLIFGEQLEERSVPHFAGAQIGKWFRELKGGVFKPIDDEEQSEMETNLGISLKLDGLDSDICLKIRLPISLKYQSFGFLQNCPKIAKFVSTIDPSIHGNVHFDIAHLDRTKKFLAFISLQSFNCPSTGNESHQKWTIRSAKDIVLESEREITGQSPDQPEEKQHFEGIGECPPNQPEEKQHFEGIGECPPNQPEEEDGQHLDIPPSQTDSNTHRSPPVSEGLNYVSSAECQPNAPTFVHIFVCWKLENDSTTFVGFNDGVNRIKCAKNQLNSDIKLGEWYKIEYCHRNDEIFILNIQPTEYKEKLFKTRVNNGIVQFEVFIRKTPNGFQTFEGGVEVIGMPTELQNKSALIGWCSLEEEFKNVLVFCEESHQKTSQSQAQNNSEMVSTNGNSKNSIEGEAAPPFPVQNNSEIVSTNANAKFSIKPGAFGRGRPRHDRLLANLAKVDGKYSDLPKLEDHSMANVNEIHEDKTQTEKLAKVGEMTETVETNEEDELPEPIEVTVPEYLIDVIRKEERLNADWDFDCKLEISTVLVNGIQIVGSSEEKMMECAKHIKATRDLLIKENMKIEEATNMEENNEEKENIPPNSEEQKPLDIFEWHSQHQGVDWLDMVVAEENKQVANLVEELTERMAPTSVDEVINCEEKTAPTSDESIICEEGMQSIDENTECDVETPKVTTPKITLQQKLQTRPPPKEAGCKIFCRPNDKGSFPNVGTFPPAANVVAPTSFSSSKSSPPTKKLALSSSNNYVRRILVPKKYHSLIVGKNGNNLTRLKHDFNVQITIPTKSSSNANITIYGNNRAHLESCKEEILAMIERAKIDEMPVKEYVIIPMNDQKHEAVHYVKFLIGRNYCKIAELRTSFPGTYIEIPYLERGEEPIIRIGGLKRDVEEIKKHFDDQIEIFRNQIVLFVEIEEKQHEKFLDKKGKLLLQLKEQHPECYFYLNKNENRIEIRGTLEFAEKAKETIHSIICENKEQSIMNPDSEVIRIVGQPDNIDALKECMQQFARGSKQN